MGHDPACFNYHIYCYLGFEGLKGLNFLKCNCLLVWVMSTFVYCHQAPNVSLMFFAKHLGVTVTGHVKKLKELYSASGRVSGRPHAQGPHSQVRSPLSLTWGKGGDSAPRVSPLAVWPTSYWPKQVTEGAGRRGLWPQGALPELCCAWGGLSAPVHWPSLCSGAAAEEAVWGPATCLCARGGAGTRGAGPA